MKSGNLNFLEPSGPLQACNRTAVPFYLYIVFLEQLKLYNTNFNFIGYQEKLTAVPYFSFALHVSPSNAVTVTVTYTPSHFITAILWIQLESPCVTYKHFEHLANGCLLGTYFLFLQEGGMQNIAALLPVPRAWLAFGKLQTCRICDDSFNPRNIIFTSLFDDEIDELFQTLHCNTL